MNTDRRHGMRIPLDLPLECHGVDSSAANNAPIQGITCRDLSSVGMSLTSPMPLDVGKTFVFSLSLPHNHRPERFEGEVRWCAGPSKRTKIGIRFPKPLDFSVPLSVTTKAVGTLQYQMKAHNHLLEQMLHALENEVPGQLVLLDTDLSITDVRGKQTMGKRAKRKVARFRGKDLRKATELTDTEVNGKKLWHVLEMCARTGQEFSTKRCSYKGRTSGAPDLFAPGNFRARISPIRDLENNVCSVLMNVKTEDPLEILDHQGAKALRNRDRLGKILRTAATGFLLKNVLAHSRNPLAHLLAELDLIRNRLERQADRSQLNEDKGRAFQATRIERARKRVGTVFENLGYLLTDGQAYVSQDAHRLNVNECLLRAIDTAKLYESLADNIKKPKTESNLPPTKTDGQELTMVFLIFLVFSQNCLSNVSNKAITCETAKEGDHISARISHNGFIRQDHLDILLHNNPLERFFLNGVSVNMTDTLLCYANFLLKKNGIRLRLTNIPGCFDLSLIIPAELQ